MTDFLRVEMSRAMGLASLTLTVEQGSVVAQVRAMGVLIARSTAEPLDCSLHSDGSCLWLRNTSFGLHAGEAEKVRAVLNLARVQAGLPAGKPQA